MENSRYPSCFRNSYKWCSESPHGKTKNVVVTTGKVVHTKLEVGIAEDQSKNSIHICIQKEAGTL